MKNIIYSIFLLSIFSSVSLNGLYVVEAVKNYLASPLLLGSLISAGLVGDLLYDIAEYR